MACEDVVELVVYYNGSFFRDVVGKLTKYVGGLVHFMAVDRDRLCYIDLLDDVANITKLKKEEILINYRIPGVTLFEVIGCIKSDQDLMEMFDLNNPKKGDKIVYEFFVSKVGGSCSQNASTSKRGGKSKSKRGGKSKSKRGGRSPVESVCEAQVEAPVELAYEPVVGLVDEAVEAPLEPTDEAPVEAADEPTDDSVEAPVEQQCELQRTKKKARKRQLFDPSGSIDLFVGLEFSNRPTLRKAFRQYAIKKHFNLMFIKNERRRLTAVCRAKECPFRVYASLLQDGIGYMIKSMNDRHTCGFIDGQGEKSVTQAWVSEQIMDRIRSNPNQTVKGITNELLREHGVGLAYHKVWRGRNVAIDAIFGSHEESFKHIPSLCAMLKKTNPGTVAEYKCTRDGRFLRLFVSLYACRLGFLRSCRPFIELDGTFLKGKYKGMLLSAISLDVDNGIVPLAIAVVEAENNESWAWFLQSLRQAIGYLPYTFMSDRQKGLIDAVACIFPGCNHRFCMRHLYANLKTMEFGKGVLLRDTFWEAACSYTMCRYEEHMQLISQFAPHAHAWIRDIPSMHWSCAFFPDGLPCNQIENNASEAWNSFLGDLRSAAICEMVDNIRKKLMEQFQQRREKSAKWTTKVVPRVTKEIQKDIEEGRCAELSYAGLDEYEVTCRDGRHTVFVNQRKCTCRRWQVDGIPCKHAISAAIHRRDDPHDYCYDFVTVGAYRITYEQIIHSMPDMSMWERVDSDEVILPPNVKRAPGRPKKNRKRAADEKASQGSRSLHGQTVHCGNCGKLGHNRKTCKHGPSKDAASSSSQTRPPRRRGRGRVSQDAIASQERIASLQGMASQECIAPPQGSASQQM